MCRSSIEEPHTKTRTDGSVCMHHAIKAQAAQAVQPAGWAQQR